MLIFLTKASYIGKLITLCRQFLSTNVCFDIIWNVQCTYHYHPGTSSIKPILKQTSSVLLFWFLFRDSIFIWFLQKRGITMNKINKIITDIEDLSPVLLESIETHNPHGAKVHLDANGILYWPVMFLYPEHTETDYIQMFCENQR